MLFVFALCAGETIRLGASWSGSGRRWSEGCRGSGRVERVCLFVLFVLDRNGSEWVVFKYYCGENIPEVNRVLKRKGGEGRRAENGVRVDLPRDVRKQFERVSRETGGSIPDLVRLYVAGYLLINPSKELEKVERALDRYLVHSATRD